VYDNNQRLVEVRQSVEKGDCDCRKQGVKRRNFTELPENIPMPATKSNIMALEEWINNHFKTSAFNQPEQMTRFEETLEQPDDTANRGHQHAKIKIIMDDLSHVECDELVHGGTAGGQVRDGVGGGGNRVQARGEPGLNDCHQEEQVLADAGLGGDDIRGGADQSLQCLEYYDAVELHGRYSGTRLFCDESTSKFLGRAQVEVWKENSSFCDKCFKIGLSTQRGEGDLPKCHFLNKLAVFHFDTAASISRLVAAAPGQSNASCL
jgi:hypothetical protein